MCVWGGGVTESSHISEGGFSILHEASQLGGSSKAAVPPPPPPTSPLVSEGCLVSH